RHREIADYCLEDVRATWELYEKVAPTLLIFNKEFRESEERDAKLRKEPAPTVLPSNESAFIEAVTQTSLALTASLDVAEEPAVLPAGTHQAMVFEKLIKSSDPEDELELG